MMNELPELISVKEMREYLRCSNQKAYELIRTKDFPAFKVGSTYRIRKEDFIIWINNQKIN